MAKIRVDLDHPIQNGETITFEAPCDCTSASDGLIVYYPPEGGTGTQSMTFTLKDSHNNTLHGLGNLFSAGALVAVIVNTTVKTAHILNADTNWYLENKLPESISSYTAELRSGDVSTITFNQYYKAGCMVHCGLQFMASSGTVFQFALPGVPTPLWTAIIPVSCVDASGTAPMVARVVLDSASNELVLYLKFGSAVTNLVSCNFSYLSIE